MKSLKAALIVFGISCIVGLYAMMRVWPAGWVWAPSQHEYEQMIMGIYATLGVFLILAAKDPLKHLSLIWFTIWSSIVHGGIMLVQALVDETERAHLLGDIPAVLLMGIVLWILVPKAQEAEAHEKRAFRRRTYTVSGFLRDIFAVVRQPGLAISALWGTAISAPFRQRLMLAVTAVNGCRYCSYLHAREALRAGLSQEEVSALLCGVVENIPDAEISAILYAQHWADTNGNPDAEARARLIELYGAEQSRVIEMALLLIRIGNLCGNSFDYLLFRLSCGRFGSSERDRVLAHGAS